MSNPYVLGTPECIAYSMGADYAIRNGNKRIDPLSGEWADDPLPNDIITTVWREIMGPSWDTFTDDNQDVRDLDIFIIDAWEEGYFGVGHDLT